MSAVIDGLPENDNVRTGNQALKDQIHTLNSSNIVQAAMKEILAITPESLATFLPMKELEEGTLSAEEAKGVKEFVKLVGDYKAQAASLEQYGLVMDQVGGGKGEDILSKSLKITRDIAAEFIRADELRDQIEAHEDQAIENISNPKRKKAAKARKAKTIDSTHADIETDGNKMNNLPSLAGHHRNFTEAMSYGNVQEAKDHLVALRKFAEHMARKIGAYNESAVEGRGRPKQFMAHGPDGPYLDKKGVYFNAKSPESVRLVSVAQVDAASAAGLYNALIKDERLGEELKAIDIASLVPEIKDHATSGLTTPNQTKPKELPHVYSQWRLYSPRRFHKAHHTGRPEAD